MNDASGSNWTEHGQPDDLKEQYYDQHGQQNQYDENQLQQYEQTMHGAPENDYMMQENVVVNQNSLGLLDDDDDDDEDDILDEMEDTNGVGDGNGEEDGNGPNNSNNPNGGSNQDQGNLLLMKFCPHDSSMLYPKADKRTKTLRYSCGLRHCRYSEETNTSMVYQNILKQEVQNVLHKVLSAVSDDPALPRTQNENCENCGYNEAVFFQSDTSDVRSDTLALIFVCCSCGHKWVK